MIPQRADILPRTKNTNDSTPLRKGIFLHSNQMQVNPLVGVKEVSKPLAQVSGDIRDPWAYMAHLTATRYAYETLISPPFSRASVIGNREGYGSFDFSILSGARRKNATRETTSPLKAWLHEHRKNPYPTKGEKIMLAILTKMTLTQISTWFANARRRLKKDNKMTWSPRNKSGDKCIGKNEKINKEENRDVEGSKDDEEMTDHARSISEADKKDAGNSEDFDLDDDVFSDANSSVEFHENTKFDNNNQITEDKFEQTKTVWANLSQASSKQLTKKIGYKGHNSPVGDLQRWVDGHFGNQSPVDFPRELTPPRTPVEEIISTKIYTAKELPEKQTSQPIPNNYVTDTPCTISDTTTSEKLPSGEPDLPSPKSSSLPERFSCTEELIRSVASNENSLRSQFRSCGLTSHREIDAVLALTTLSSR